MRVDSWDSLCYKDSFTAHTIGVEKKVYKQEVHLTYCDVSNLEKSGSSRINRGDGFSRIFTVAFDMLF